MNCMAPIGNNLESPEQQYCGAKARQYRQCPHRKCKLEIGYCAAHGGDSRAIDEMLKHIPTHEGKIDE